MKVLICKKSNSESMVLDARKNIKKVGYNLFSVVATKRKYSETSIQRTSI